MEERNENEMEQRPVELGEELTALPLFEEKKGVLPRFISPQEMNALIAQLQQRFIDHGDKLNRLYESLLNVYDQLKKLEKTYNDRSIALQEEVSSAKNALLEGVRSIEQELREEREFKSQVHAELCYLDSPAWQNSPAARQEEEAVVPSRFQTLYADLSKRHEDLQKENQRQRRVVWVSLLIGGVSLLGVIATTLLSVLHVM